MTLSRSEMLYRRKLVKPEGTGKVVPLDHILQRKLIFYPKEAEKETFDMFEIGTGNGEFITSFARNNPTKKIVGIEIEKARIEKTRLRLERDRITNVSMIYGDARVAFYKHFPDDMFESGFVLFPDPWPRNRHRHNRLLQRDFIEVIIKKLKIGGEFILATDVEEYARWAEENLASFDTVKNFFGDKKMSQDLTSIASTHFWRKWKHLGREFWMVKYEKIS